MTDDLTMTLSTPEGKRGRDPGDTATLTPSPNPKDKKMQRDTHVGKKATPSEDFLDEIEDNPERSDLTPSNLNDKFDDVYESDGANQQDSIDLTNTNDKVDHYDTKNNNNTDNKKEKNTEKDIYNDNNNEEQKNHDDEEDEEEKEADADKNAATDKDEEQQEDMSVEEQVFCMDFSHGFLNPTDAYDNLSTDIKKHRTVFMASDGETLKQFIDDAPEIFQLPANTTLPLSVEKWHDIFVAAAPILAKKNPKRKYKQFGLTLAGTHPQDLLPPTAFDSDRILESPLACALGGAYQFFGCLWTMDKDFLIDWMVQKITPTDLWEEKMPIKTRNLALGFSAKEIFDEAPTSFHCIEASMAKIMKMKNRENPEEWAVKLRKHLNSSGQVHLPRNGQGTIKDNLMRIAKTHPRVFTGNIVDESKLTRSSMTALWTAVYTILGGVWWNAERNTTTISWSISPHPDDDDDDDDGFTVVQNKKTPLKTALKKSPPPPPAKAAIPTYASKVTQNSRKTPTQRTHTKPAQASRQASGCFLQKKPMIITKKVGKGPKRKFITFFKVRLPRVNKPFGPEAEAEVVKSAHMLFQIIWKFDPRAVLLAYRGSSTATLTKDSDPLASRSQLQLYADNVFVKQDANTWMKIQVAHDKPRTEFEEDDNFQGSLQEADLWFHPDKVQARSTASIGWLLGSTPDSCNITDMKASNEAHPDLGIECEPRPQNIRLYPGKNNIPFEQQVKAIHICVATENVPLGRRRYGRCYGGRNRSLGNVPDKQLFKFIPECSDPKFPISVNHRSAVIRVMSKQKHLLLSTVVIPTSTIAGLHVFWKKLDLLFVIYSCACDWAMKMISLYSCPWLSDFGGLPVIKLFSQLNAIG